MSSEFTGLVAVVTGAGSGIGLAVAQHFHDNGAKVYGLDLQEGSMSSYAHFIHCDIGDPESVSSAFAELAKHTSVIDILANNAGVGATGTVEDATEEEWQRVLNINVVGTSRVSAAAMKLLRKSKSPAIVNTCSIASTAGIPKRAVYSASKGAIMSLTLGYGCRSCERRNPRQLCKSRHLRYSMGRLACFRKLQDPAAERAALEARQPMGRLSQRPDEVASAIAYLASPRQASTTGTILAVDGGMQGLRLPK